VDTKPAKETLTEHEGTDDSANLPVGNSEEGSEREAYRFRNLYRELNEELLRDSWRLLRKDAALGVDRVSATEKQTWKRTSTNWWSD
jgi:hypothetical protein